MKKCAQSVPDKENKENSGVSLAKPSRARVNCLAGAASLLFFIY